MFNLLAFWAAVWPNLAANVLWIPAAGAGRAGTGPAAQSLR
jgi:hypothetical protein